jgi:hypothetical protein
VITRVAVEKVLQSGFLYLSTSRNFLILRRPLECLSAEKEFFNSHAIYQQLS